MSLIYFILIIISVLSPEQKIIRKKLYFISEISLELIGNEKSEKIISINSNPNIIYYNEFYATLSNFISGEEYIKIFLNRNKYNITLQWDYKLKDCSRMFYEINMTKVDLTKFDFSEVKNMSEFFSGCESLELVILGNINTSMVSDMSFMFHGCIKLKNLEINNINTSNVINMEYMFGSCQSLTSLNLSNFNTSLVNNMDSMFTYCYSLEVLDIHKFNTSLVSIMNGMFFNCTSLLSLDLSSFDTSKVTIIYYMFYGCKSLKILNIDNFDTSNVIFMDQMFYGCNALISLNIYNFSTLSLYSSEITDIIEGNSYTIYCINEQNIENRINIPKNIKNNCSDACFKHNHKIIFETNKCVDDCRYEDKNKYEYNNICYSSCPDGTYKNEINYKCEGTLTCKKFYNYNHTDCFDAIPEGYYLNDSDTNTLDICYKNCKTCNKKDNGNNNNCLTCKNGLFLELGNCVTNCTRGYLNDSENSKMCKCPYNISCNSCSEESLKMNSCITCDNKGGFYEKSDDYMNTTSFIRCYKKQDGYYLDNNIILKPCYQSCKTCHGEGNKNIHNCIECKANFNFIKDSLYNYTNCYPKCLNYHYFDINNDYHCTTDNNCPDDYKNLIPEKNKCIENCLNDDIYIYEYNNICYEKCPNGTHNSTDGYFLCIKDLQCEKYYNYTQEGCLDYIPQGYYLNDSIKKTIDKCNIKCNNCTKESMKLNLCISCNNEYGFYQKINDSLNQDSFINCYNNSFEGYFLDKTDNYYKPCYSSCKTCNESGNIFNNKCTECYNNYYLVNSNCYKICEYYHYFDSSNIYQCTKDNKCPDNYKLIKQKNKCIDECNKDDYYKFEYNNTCFSYLICEKYYNYNHTECLNEIPEGFYLNDTNLKTIDKCNNKCGNCTYESMQKDLCISCNNNNGYYEKIIDLNYLNKLEFINCYQNIEDGYYLDKDDKAYKSCYSTCKKCDEKGTIINNKCIECYPDNFLENGNCYKNCTYYHYFDVNKTYYCTFNNECPNIYDKLIVEKKLCIDNCINDDIYKYEYNNICYKNCPRGTINKNYICKLYNSSSTLENWNILDFFNGNYNLSSNKDEESTEINDKIINSIREDIINGNIDLSNITNGSSTDLLIKTIDTYYQITSSKNQRNNIYNNISSIYLGECENILKKIYEIDVNLPLIIFKVDYFKQDSKVPVIGYDVFHPITKERLNISYCKDELINFNIPVSIDENNLFKYDPNSDYYTNECTPHTSENGTDILLNDRQNEFNSNNMSLCENSCEFAGYQKETKKAICECEIKYQQLVISEIANNNEIFYNNFSSNNGASETITMKCYYTLFTKDGLVENIGSYIFIFIVALFTSTGILYWKCGHRLLEDDMEEILNSKEKKNIQVKTKIKKMPNNKKRKSIKNNTYKDKKNIKKINLSKNKNFSSSRAFTNNNKELNLKNEKKTTSNNAEEKQIFFTAYELNTMCYKNALKYDKRKFFNYYISLIKTKHPLILSFCPIKDYNSSMIKLSIFLLFISFHFCTNTFFFNESTIHKIYLDKGTYDFIYFLSYIVFSFLISDTLITLIRNIILSEKNICEIKKENTYKEASKKILKVKKCLAIKYVIYYIIGVIILSFLWYYLSSFGAVYKNTQIYLIKNTAISIAFSFLCPFIINILPGIIRFYALKAPNKDKKCLYNFSLILQFI